MRRVTRKPPKIFTAAMKMPSAAKSVIKIELEPIYINAPRITMDEIAFVTAIKGVCKLCATFQITWKPMKTDKTKTMKCCMKLAGAISPTPSTSAPPTAKSVTWFLVCALKAAISAARFYSGVSSLGFSFFEAAAMAATFGGGGG